MFTSAALYFGRERSRSIPQQWLERAQQFFEEYEQSQIQFTAADGGFAVDEFNVLADDGGEIVRFGETLPARRAELIREIQKGTIRSLFLDSPEDTADGQGDPRLMLTVSSTTWDIYLGAQEELVSEISAAVKQAYKLSEGLFGVRYGIGFKMPLEQHPGSYASGFRPPLSPSEAFDFIRHRDQWMNRKKTPDELWCDELTGKQRHLTGLFRGDYPANILSNAHVENADLKSQPIGTLSELDVARGLWLWELSDSEIPEAQKLLESRGVLVSQADES